MNHLFSNLRRKLNKIAAHDYRLTMMTETEDALSKKYIYKDKGNDFVSIFIIFGCFYTKKKDYVKYIPIRSS